MIYLKYITMKRIHTYMDNPYFFKPNVETEE